MNTQNKHVFFICGIDTDVGKTVATGLLARDLAAQGKRVTTQKIAQTGCHGIASDILVHRRIQGIAPTEHDHNHTTCPYVFAYPSSPHQAAEREGSSIATERITAATRTLLQHYDTVLLEGAGGLMSPLNRRYTQLDYIAEQGYPIILVSSGRLGSINHTLLSLNAAASRRVRIHSLIYNRHPAYDPIISAETERFLQQHLQEHYPDSIWQTLDRYEHE